MSATSASPKVFFFVSFANIFCLRYLSCEGVKGVPYENINVDQITRLCNEGFTKVLGGERMTLL